MIAKGGGDAFFVAVLGTKTSLRFPRGDSQASHAV
jgi:hypothetical protein